jgi:mediator of RNA polymerase II transcription subunit 16
MLEYCMISGLDALDSMLMIKPQMIDSIVDRMTDNFNRQPNFITQFYYLKFLTMKINLYRFTISGQNKAHDLICLLNLISISTAFKSLLRPADLMTKKNGPAENLASKLNLFKINCSWNLSVIYLEFICNLIFFSEFIGDGECGCGQGSIKSRS